MDVNVSVVLVVSSIIKYYIIMPVRKLQKKLVKITYSSLKKSEDFTII